MGSGGIGASQRERYTQQKRPKHSRYCILTHGQGCMRGNVLGIMGPSRGFLQRLQNHYPEWEAVQGVHGEGVDGLGDLSGEVMVRGVGGYLIRPHAAALGGASGPEGFLGAAAAWGQH